MTPRKATAESSSAASVAVDLAFHWDVSVRGTTVTIGGSWSGGSATLSTADADSVGSLSTAAEVGSGVLGYSSQLEYQTGYPATGVYQGADYGTSGSLPVLCTGPVLAQHRVLPARTLTVPTAGDYVLDMDTHTCTGERHDTIPVVVTDVPLVLTQTLDVAPTAEVGVPLTIDFDLGSTRGGPGNVIDVVGQGGAVGRAGSAVYGSGCVGPGQSVSRYNASWTFSSPGTYVILIRQVCDGLPAETGPAVPQSYILPGPVPGYGGTAADALALARADPAHASAVVVHVLPRPGSSATATTSSSPSTTPSTAPSPTAT